jgi:hypothetical protein
MESVNNKFAAMAVKADIESTSIVGKTVVYDNENGKESVRLNPHIKILAALNITISLDSPTH